MRIKRIELIGFKSFSDRTVLSFSEPITAVVGPNGCGKSNIVDAIRWCMGEQSAKHLRGSAMNDVIFAGSESRGPAAMAEVSLTFEDVGFSAETLELELNKSPELDDLGGEERLPSEIEDDEGGEGEGESEGEGEGAGGEVELAEAAEGDGGEGELAEAGDGGEVELAEAGEGDGGEVEFVEAPDAEPGAVGAETAAVQELLADRPAVIDFSKYTEVTITRRLFRDGTSLYMINKAPCRLREVRDFFLGTGVGTHAYSIIEQGRIGMIVSARPQDRRALIDEAAGITKFKSKKKLAERKLDQTRQNLLRVSDIVSELAKRMGALKRQAQKAKRYRRYRNELRDIELWKASHKLLEMRAEEKVLATQLDEAKTELASARAEFDKGDAVVIAERAELAVEERRLAGLQERIYDLENRIKLAENKIEFQSREADELDERVASAQGEIRSLGERRSQAVADLESQRAELGELDAEIAAHRDSMQSRDTALAEARADLSEAQTLLDEARTELARARADLARAESQRDALTHRHAETSARLERIRAEADEARAQMTKLESEVKKVDAQLSQLRQTRLDLDARTDKLEARQAELEERAASSEAEVETLRTEVHRRRSRLQSLKEIHDKYEGFARGTKAVMQGKSEVFGNGQQLYGLVADVVEVPEQLELAVEAALGDRLGGILVDSHSAGMKAIDYLKQKSAGRSAFVPTGAPAISARPAIEFEDRSPESVGDGAGVLGQMIDLVSFDSGFEKVGPMLFGDALVVESLERAIELHDQGVTRTLVTLEGDVVDGRGVVTGGSRDAQAAGVLAQKREIRELEEITAELESDLASATARLLQTKTELGQVSKTLQSLRTETHDGEIAITGHEKDLSRCRGDLDRLRSRATTLGTEKLELEERLASIEREVQEMSELHLSASERIERWSEQGAGLGERVSRGSARVEELSSAVTEEKVKVAQLGEKRASIEAAALQLELADRELAERIGKLEASISEGVERAARLRSESAELGESLGTMRAEHGELAQSLDEGRKSYELRVAEVQMTEVQVRELRSRAEKLSGESQNLELRLNNLEMNRRVLVGTCEDRFQISLPQHVGDYHLRPAVGPEEEKRLEELRRIIDRMGSNINLTAIEEFQEVSERHEFLSTQQADLENAVEQLERAIRKINRTSRKLFRDTFNAVNAQFQEVFPRLFRGGKARLQLTEAEDILEAGVEVIAQPPGKKNTTVDQLSGGEKALTAVALIFAIFLIKPSPFCLLDEVDAPLDDVNVDRYNEIVREMTDRSQFIIITHNKRTMEIADHLYGVTMQEPGCSKLVTVNLAKIEEGQAA